MTLIEITLKKEKKRIEYMLSEYERRIKELPKGSLTQSKCGNKTYTYLKYRDGSKVVSKYIPENECESLSKKIEERKHIETMIRSLKQELKIANKALGVKL